MDKNIPITIRQVCNGFILEPLNLYREPAVPTYSDTMVFNTLVQLKEYLDRHFFNQASDELVGSIRNR